MYVKISIKKTELSNNPLEDFFKLLGLENRTKTATKILLLLKQHKKLNATELSKLTNLSRGSILNQLENLMEKEFVFKYGTYYYLREDNFEEIINEIEKDISKTLQKLKEMAKILDNM